MWKITNFTLDMQYVCQKYSFPKIQIRINFNRRNTLWLQTGLQIFIYLQTEWEPVYASKLQIQRLSKHKDLKGSSHHILYFIFHLFFQIRYLADDCSKHESWNSKLHVVLFSQRFHVQYIYKQIVFRHVLLLSR